MLRDILRDSHLVWFSLFAMAWYVVVPIAYTQPTLEIEMKESTSDPAVPVEVLVPPTMEQKDPKQTPIIEPSGELQKPVSVTEQSVVHKDDSAEMKHLLPQLGVRIEALYTMGSPVVQGFQIPAVRLSGEGEVGSWVGYRLAIGQTREFSTVLLPQLIPVEAVIDLGYRGEQRMTFFSDVKVKLGMFTPTQNPWWSPDLGELRLSEYHEVHQEMLLDRDIGAELNYEIVKGLNMGAGIFNGNGIFSQNTNNTKAVTGFLLGEVGIGTRSALLFGASGYYLTQSESTSVNYIENSVGNVYLGVSFWRLKIIGELLFGQFRDATRSIQPSGSLASVTINILRWLDLFGRLEYLETPPSQSSGILSHYQAGFRVQLETGLSGFFSYRYTDPGDGSISNILEYRLRLAL